MSNYFDTVADAWDQNPMRIQRAKATAEKVRAVQIVNRRSLVDFGGGTGLLGLMLKADFERVTVVDTSTEMLRQAKINISQQRAHNVDTAHSLFEDNRQYSGLVALMSLHHVTALDGFMREVAKLIVPGGALMIADLFEDDGAYHQHEPDFDGHNGFNVEELSQVIESFGFKVVMCDEYFNIEKETEAACVKSFPLFFLAAIKT